MNAIHHTYLLLAAMAALVLAGIGSSLVARRFGAPLLLVFLIFGMLAGVDGPGGIHFSDYSATYGIGSFALAVILFDGGLRTRRESFRGVLAPTLLLATVGVVVTAGLTSLAAHWLLGLNIIEALLLGAVVASTDAAAVFFLLRAGGLQLRSRIASTLEIESSANDPVAVLMTTLLAEYLAAPSGSTPPAIAFELVSQFVVGGLVGVLGGFLIATALRKLALPGGLAALGMIAAAILVFGVTGSLHGSAFLAVYVAGVIVGNRKVPGFVNLLSVLDAGTWLCQIVMFLVLGLIASPHSLDDALWPALGVAAFLILVGRPLAVTLCLLPFGYRKRDVGFISWVGLRGAVGIFLASIPMLMQLPDAALIFNVAFIVVLTSLLVQGWTLGMAARVFQVALPHRDRTIRRVDIDLPGSLERELVGYPVEPGASILGGSTMPGWAKLTMIVRGGTIVMPEPNGALVVGDYAYLLAPPGRAYRLDWLFAPPEEAREAEREIFGEFRFDADVRLGEVAEFYNLPIRPRDAPLTLTEHFAQCYEHTIEVGDSVPLGPVTLIARELQGDAVSKVGLKLEYRGGVLVRQARLRATVTRWFKRP